MAEGTMKGTIPSISLWPSEVCPVVLPYTLGVPHFQLSEQVRVSGLLLVNTSFSLLPTLLPSCSNF